MSDYTQDNNRIAKNTVFLFIRMFIVLILNLYISRVLLHNLGVTDYGVYNVVSGFVMMFGFLNSTMSASIQRYYNFELGRNDEGGVQQVYVAGFYIHLAISIIAFILLETIGLWYINRIMVIPEDRLFAANVLFQVSVFSLVLLVLQIPYLGMVLAMERLDLFAIVSVLDVVLKLVIVLVIPIIPYDKLIVYSVLLSFVSILDFVLYFGYTKKHFKSIRLKGTPEASMIRSLLSFSGWNMLGTFSFMLKGQGLNLVLNSFFGPVVNAARGLASQVSNAVNGFSSNITTSFRPQIVKSYASSHVSRSIRLMFIESKVCFMLVSILIIPLILEIGLILRIWLGGDNIPDGTSVFTCLTLVDCLVCTLNTPCTHIVFATGRLKAFQIGSSIVHILLLVFSFFCLKMGLPAVSVFIITILFSIINQAVCIVLGNRVIPFGLKEYLLQVIIPCLLFLIPCWVLSILPRLVLPESIVRLVLISLLDFVASIVCGWFFLFNESERGQVSEFTLVQRIKSVLGV